MNTHLARGRRGARFSPCQTRSSNMRPSWRSRLATRSVTFGPAQVGHYSGGAHSCTQLAAGPGAEDDLMQGVLEASERRPRQITSRETGLDQARRLYATTSFRRS